MGIQTLICLPGIARRGGRRSDIAHPSSRRRDVSDSQSLPTPIRVCRTEPTTVKSLTEYLWFEVPGRRGFINITPKIEELVSQSGVREGLCLVNAMHITASEIGRAH